MPRRPLSGPAAFWGVTAVYVLVLLSSGVPSPLYRVYQAEFGFSPGVLTVVFGIYALALLAALLVVGSLSDHVGRRPVLVAGLAVQTLAMVLFLVADGVGWLMAARVVQGLATGAMTGAFGAALLDLQRPERPMGPLVNTASPGLGLAAGALGAAALVQFAPSPTDWLFGALTGVFAVLAVAVLVLLPESSPRRPGAWASLRPWVAVPAPQRPAFLVVLPVFAAAWAFGGLMASLGPSLAAEVYGIDDHLVGTLVVALVNGVGVVGSLSMRTAPPDRSLLAGALVFAVGVAGIGAALPTGLLWLFFGASVVAGWGFGAAFLGSVALVTRDVAPGQRAALISAVLTAGYLSFSIPAVAAGIAAGRWGLTVTAEVFAALVVAAALAAAAGLLWQRRRAAAPAVAPVLADSPV